MTTTPTIAKEPAARSPSPSNIETSGEPHQKVADKPDMVTLEQLAREMKVPPRDARMLLRLAAKQTKLYPTLGKEHITRQPWAWTPGSKALADAKKALTASADAG